MRKFGQEKHNVPEKGKMGVCLRVQRWFQFAMNWGKLPHEALSECIKYDDEGLTVTKCDLSPEPASLGRSPVEMIPGA